jgi:hypothetical protein
MLRISAFFVITAFVVSANLPGSPTPATVSAAARVDQLIPWLLDEDRQFREIPFAKVIFDTTRKQVLPVNPKDEVDQRVIKQISAACDEIIKRFNTRDSAIQMFSGSMK